METCKICNRECKNIYNLSKHLSNYHKTEITIEQYYRQYINNNDSCHNLLCNNKVKFNSLIKGFYKYCCQTCGSIGTRIKTKETMLEKYGVENALQLNTTREKGATKKREIKLKKIEDAQTILLNSIDVNNQTQCQICGKEYSTLHSLTIHIRIHNISVQNYYNKYISKSDPPLCSVCNKVSPFKSITEGYWTYHLKCSSKAQEVKDKHLIYNISELKKRILKSQNEFDIEFQNLDNIKSQHDMMNIKCLKCDYIYSNRWYNLMMGYGKCPNCFPKYTSPCLKEEEEVYNFIRELLPSETVQRGMYGIIYSDLNEKLELDIYLPERRLAIEFDGLYWHNDEIKMDQSYHLIKTEKCKEKNIQLIHIFEDEWIHKKDIVKSILKYKLGISTSKVNARECKIKEISTNEKNIFLNNNHLQGSDKAKIKIGAFYNEDLVAVMTFSNGNISRGGNPTNKLSWELSRFCIKNEYVITGIANRMLEYFKKNNDWNEIYSYADRRWSNGNVYLKLGFKLDTLNKPTYWYVNLKDITRIHRYNLRKKKTDPKDITELELRRKEGYLRIYDCGTIRFSLTR